MSGTYRRRRLWSLALAAVVAVTIVPAAHAHAWIAGRSAVVRSTPPTTIAAARCEPGADEDGTVPWFRLDPILDGDGALAGQRLTAGSGGDVAPVELSLGPESFASGPTGGLVVSGSDDGRRSTIRVLDAARACVARTFTTTDLVRRAVLDATGETIFEHQLDRRSRASLGVWRRVIEGAGAAERILEPLPANDRIGLVFATELFWSDDGATLVVLSCGEAACLTRLVNIVDGTVRVVDDAAVGQTLGMAGGRLVAYGRCQGLPCPIVVHDPEAGSTRTIVPAAGLASVIVGRDGPSVAFEDADHGSIGIVDLDGSRQRDLATPVGELRVVPPPFLASAGAELPRGLFALGADGRPGGDRGSNWRVVDADDGRLLPATEVVP